MGVIKEDDPELHKTFMCNTKAKEEKSLVERFKKFSDWSRVVKAVAKLRRQIREYKVYKLGRKERSRTCYSQTSTRSIS